MIYLFALAAGLIAGAAIGFGVGFAAADLFTRLAGPQDGGSAMGGFFGVGPFGLVAGFLLTFGLVVRYGGGSTAIANACLVAGTCVFTLGSVLVLMEYSRFAGRRAAMPSHYQVTLEFALPEGLNPAAARWNYAGESTEELRIEHEFYVRRAAEDGRTVVSRVLNVLDTPRHRTIAVSAGGPAARFVLPLAANPPDWTAWTVGEGGIGFRCKMKRMR